MKSKIISLVTLAIMAAGSLYAQSPVYYPLEYGENVLPLTAVKVTVTVEKETVVPGPYARYAQKFLGAMAPLSARETYNITGATLGIAQYGFDGATAPQENTVRINSNVYSTTDFVKFSIDRTSLAEKSAETMAQEAANTIYTLRKRRFDLITGEAGEHVYGAGMQAAIEEMARMEEEYVSLFMGKTSLETFTEVFDIIPEAGKTNYIVCRFSPEEGLLPESDLGAAPIVLNMTPEEGAPEARPDKKAGSLYRVARWTECRVMDGAQQLAAKRLPVFQFGDTVQGK